MSTSLIIAAIGTTIGIVKFKLIEELVKKISSDEKNVKVYAALLLFATILVLAVAASLLEVQSTPEPPKTIVESDPAPTPTDLEVKVKVIEDGIEKAEDIITQVKENKRIEDSTYVATRPQRWVYQIGDWTNDDDRILELHKQLLITENIKVLKQKRNYLLFKEDNLSKEDLEEQLDQLRTDLDGIQIKLVDINEFLTRKKDNFVTSTETFGRRKNKIKLECLVAD